MVRPEYMNKRIASAVEENGDPDVYRTGPPWGNFDPLYNCVLALVLRWEPLESVLDLGCYLGDFTVRLREVGAKRIVGVDISTEAVKYANARYPGIDFIASDIADLEYVDEFDLVVASGVLNFNHLSKDDYPRRVSKIHGFLHDGGYLIIQNPESAMKRRKSFAFKELGKYFELLHHLESSKYGDYAYPGRREHGKSRFMRLYRKRV
jgi:trans-aconitate methyltransferase